MTDFDNLLGSDSISVPMLTANIHPPLSMVQRLQAFDQCLPKDTNQLSFRIPLRAFGIPADDQIPFHSVDGNLWTTNTPLDLTVGRNHVDRIDGSIRTRLSHLATVAIGTGCDGHPRVFRSALTTIPSESTLNVHSGIFSVPITDITASGNLGQVLTSVSFSVQIHPNRWSDDSCGHRYYMPGRLVLTAAPVNIISADPVVGPPTFRWTEVPPEGIVYNGPTDEPTIDLTLLAPGTYDISVQVAVVNAAGGGQETGMIRLVVPTEEEASLWTAICRWINHQRVRPNLLVGGSGSGGSIGGIRYVDPWWDPTPDELRTVEASVNQRYTMYELRQIQGQARKAERLAADLAAAAGAAIKQRAGELDLKATDAVPEQRLTEALAEKLDVE